MKESESAEPPSSRLGAIVLAAGQGTRMRSGTPKALHPVGGVPMVHAATELAARLACSPTVVVLGHGSAQVREVLPESVEHILQEPQLGTGHAVQCAQSALEGRADRVLILYADTPLLTERTVRRLLQHSEGAAVGLLTAYLADPRGYGRIVRDKRGLMIQIVEDPEASEGALASTEVNGGICCFDAAWLWAHLPDLPLHDNGEFYLTDLVSLAASEKGTVATLTIDDPDEVLGINTRAHLARANEVLWERTRTRLLEQGVSMLQPSSSFVDAAVQVEPDVVIHPNSFLRGATRIGAGCEIGPNTLIVDSMVGPGCRIVMSVVEGSELGRQVVVGPFSHVRPGSRIGDRVELGNYAEVKASVIGPGTRAHHFSYVGDAQLGSGVNVGAGTITCNYDGERKHKTVVGDGVFLGSDTMLVAPITVGEAARTGAGSVVTRNVPPGELWVGVPARRARGQDRHSETRPEP